MAERQNNKILNETDIQIELARILRVLWKHAWIIFTAAMLGGCITYLGIRQFMVPVYQSGFTAYVNNRSDGKSVEVSSLNSSDLQASQALVKTYTRILSSRSVLLHAAEKADLDYGYEKLKKIIETEAVGDTEIISVQITMEDPEEAFQLAQAIAEITPEKIESIIAGSSMKIIDEPVMPQKPCDPGFIKYTLLGVLAGALLTGIILVFIMLLDDRVRSEKELEERMKICILGTIPDLTQRDGFVPGYGYKQKKNGKGEES